MTDTEARKHIRALLDASATDRITGRWQELRVSARAFLDTPEPAVLTVEGGGDEPATHAMLTAGGRAIGSTMRWDNHYERAQEVWRAVVAAKRDPNALPEIPNAEGAGPPDHSTELATLRSQLAKQSEEMAGMRRAVLEEVVKYHDTEADHANAACWANDAYVAGNANERLRVHERAAGHFRSLIDPKTGEG